MPSGNLTLLEASKSSSDKLKSGVVQTIIQESPLVNMLPWTSFEGNALQHEVEETLPSVQFRQVNSTYSKSFGTTSMYFWGVAILGGEVGIDNFLVNVTGTRRELKAKQFAALAKANAMRFDYEVFNGDGTNDGFKGFKTLITEGFGQTQTHSATGAPLSSAAGADSLDAAIDLFRNQGGPQYMLGNRTVRRQITKYARSTVVGDSMVDWEKNSLGKQVMSYDGIPYVILGDCVNSSGTIVPVLPFTEDPGDTVLDCTSVYFVKFGPDDITGLLGKGGSMEVRDFGEQQASPSHMGRLEWYPGIGIFNKYSIVRVTGITAT